MDSRRLHGHKGKLSGRTWAATPSQRWSLCSVVQHERHTMLKGNIMCLCPLRHTLQKLAFLQVPLDWHLGPVSPSPPLLDPCLMPRYLDARWPVATGSAAVPQVAQSSLPTISVSIFLCPGARRSSRFAPAQPWPGNCQLLLVMTLPMTNKCFTPSSKTLAELKYPELF